MADVKIGQVVELKSGGPKMVVVRPSYQVNGQDEVVCVYWNPGSSKFERDTFPEEGLILWDE